MSFQTCAVKVKNWYDENAPDIKMPDREIEAAAKWLESSGEGATTPAQFAAKMQDALDEYTKRQTAKERAQKAQDALRNAKAVKNTRATSAAFIEKGIDEVKAPFQAALAHIEGGALPPGVGSNKSPLQMTRSLQTDFMSFLRRALGKNELYLQNLRIQDPASLDIYRAKWLVENKGDLTAVKNEQAIEIAKSMKAFQNRVLSEKQAVNPFMEAAKNFIAERNHNQERIMVDPEGREGWLDQVMKSYGKNSLLGLTDEEKLQVFSGIYDKIKAGIWGNEYAGKQLFNVKGAAGDLADRMAQGRVFVPESPEAEWEYAKRYGDDLYTALSKQSLGSASEVARMSKWGSRAQDNFVNYISAVEKSISPEQRAYFEANEKKLVKAFRVSFGSQNAPAVNLGAKIAQGFGTWEFWSKAGMHLPRSLHDFQNAVSMGRDMFGTGLVENTAQMARHMARAFLNYGDAKEHLGDLGVYYNGAAHEWINAVTNPEQLGASGKLGQALGKLNLGEVQQVGIKSATARFFAKKFGDLANTPFVNLKDVTKQGLTRYDLHGDWDLIRHATETLPFAQGETRQMITPEAIRSLDNDRVELHLRKTGQWTNPEIPPQRIIDAAKYEAARNYGTMLNEHTSLVAANADLRQRRFMYGDTTVNDGDGLARRLLWQFKQAGLVNADITRRTYFNGTGSKSNVSGLAQHLVMGAFYGLLGEAMVQLAAGKSPDALNGPAIAHAIAAPTGVWADAIINAFRQTSRSDKIANGLESALGPSISTATEAAYAIPSAAYGYYQRAMGNDNSDIQTRWLTHLVQTNTPAQNVFYLKAGMNYFLFNELHHFLGDEGYLEALRKQADKSGSSYLVQPGSRFGGE